MPYISHSSHSTNSTALSIVDLSSSHGLIAIVKEATPIAEYPSPDSTPSPSPWIDKLVPLSIVIGCSFGLFLGQQEIFGNIMQYVNLSGGTNVLVAVGLMVMMYPPLAKVQWTSITSIFKHLRQLIMACVLNWIVSPFCMYLLSWIFFGGHNETGSRAGMNLVGCARCFTSKFSQHELHSICLLYRVYSGASVESYG